MLTLGLALAALIGLSLGLLGGGGSILTVPIFVYVLGFDAKPAIAMTLLVVGTTSLVGAVGHWRAGHVNLRMALVFGLVAMAGAYAGARLATYLSGGVQLDKLSSLERDLLKDAFAVVKRFKAIVRHHFHLET